MEVSPALKTLDLESLVLGKRLGEGCYREVYEFVPSPSKYVVKVAKDKNAQHCNILEWNTWRSVKWEKDLSPLFAPVLTCSAAGVFLIQRRVKPLVKDIPKKLMLPEWVTDINTDNLGMLDGRIVIIDYGNQIFTGKMKQKEVHNYGDFSNDSSDEL